jgi:hypothetical protein
MRVAGYLSYSFVFCNSKCDRVLSVLGSGLNKETGDRNLYWHVGLWKRSQKVEVEGTLLIESR